MQINLDIQPSFFIVLYSRSFFLFVLIVGFFFPIPEIFWEVQPLKIKLCIPVFNCTRRKMNI